MVSLQAADALALEHGDLVVAVFLGGLLKLGGDQAQRVDALALPRLEGRIDVVLYLLDQGHGPSLCGLRT